MEKENQSSKQSILEDKILTMREHLNNQQQVISQIETKIQKLLLRPPKTGDIEPEPERPFPDFVSNLGYELRNINSNNQRLSDIVSHLSEVI